MNGSNKRKYRGGGCTYRLVRSKSVHEQQGNNGDWNTTWGKKEELLVFKVHLAPKKQPSFSGSPALPLLQRWKKEMAHPSEFNRMAGPRKKWNVRKNYELQSVSKIIFFFFLKHSFPTQFVPSEVELTAMLHHSNGRKRCKECFNLNERCLKKKKSLKSW